MDDRFGRLHAGGWSWGHSGEDNRYCDAVSIAPPRDGTSEPYVDSLHQLNKIVERILPESSTTISTSSVRTKSETTLRKQHQVHSSAYDVVDAPREPPGKRAVHGSNIYESMVKKSPTEMSGDFMHETFRVKMMRTNDSLNDSAYETFVGDGSTDAADVADQGSKGSRNDIESTGRSPKGRVAEIESNMLSPSERGFTSDDADQLNNCLLIKKEGSDDKHIVRMHRQMSDADKVFDVRLRKQVSDGSSVKVSADETYTDGSMPASCHSEETPKHTVEYISSVRMRQNSSDSRVRLPYTSEWSSSRRSVEIDRYTDDEDYLNDADSSVQHCDNSSPIKGSSLDGRQHVSSMNDAGIVGGLGDDDSKSFTCPHCAYSATKKGQVRKHMSVHGIFLCAHCDYSCDRAETLEDHRRVRHPGLCGRRLCKKCRVLFQSTELDAHEQQCSGEKQRWACPTCNKEFKFLSVMKAHAHKWHPPAEDNIGVMSPMKPESTSAITVTSAVTVIPPPAISSPLRDSSGQSTPSIVKPDSTPAEAELFQCPERGKTFKTKWTLNNHSMLHAGADTPFCCDINGCNGVMFRSDKELNCHRMTVHQLGPTKYQCAHPGCTMQFAKYGHFKRHQQTHAGGKRFFS